MATPAPAEALGFPLGAPTTPSPKRPRRSREPSGDGQQWTRGPALAARATGVLLLASVCSGPLALVLVTAGGSGEAPAVAAATPVDVDGAAAAGERATHMVSTWLSATRDEPGQLTELYGVDVRVLPELPLEHRDVAVASVVDAGAGLWSVTVGVDVLEPTGAAPEESGDVLVQPTVEEEPPHVWVRRYYELAIAVAEGQVAALTLPAPVPAPSALEQPSLRASRSLSASGPLAEAVTAFVAALVAGDGELSRYTSPGVVYAPLDPPPFDAVRLLSLEGDIAPEEESVVPEDGTAIEVRAVMELTRPDGQPTTAEYVLHLTTRAGRWEVFELAPAPALATTSTTTTTTTP